MQMFGKPGRIDCGSLCWQRRTRSWTIGRWGICFAASSWQHCNGRVPGCIDSEGGFSPGCAKLTRALGMWCACCFDAALLTGQPPGHASPNTGRSGCCVGHPNLGSFPRSRTAGGAAFAGRSSHPGCTPAPYNHNVCTLRIKGVPGRSVPQVRENFLDILPERLPEQRENTTSLDFFTMMIV